MQSQLILLSTLAVILLAQQMGDDEPSAEKRMRAFAFAKRSPYRRFAFAKRSMDEDEEEEETDNDVEKRARFAFAKRSPYRSFAFAKRARFAFA